MSDTYGELLDAAQMMIVLLCAWQSKPIADVQLVIAGFTRTGLSRFSSLLLGYYDDAGKLRYAGRVKMGWNYTTENILGEALEDLKRKTSPYVDPPAKEAATWVTPKLVAEVAYLERTRDGELRHAAFKGLCLANPKDIRLNQAER